MKPEHRTPLTISVNEFVTAIRELDLANITLMSFNIRCRFQSDSLALMDEFFDGMSTVCGPNITEFDLFLDEEQLKFGEALSITQKLTSFHLQQRTHQALAVEGKMISK